MSNGKHHPNKVGFGIEAERPSIASEDVSFGDEYFASDTGDYSKCTSTALGAKQWTVANLGAGIQHGTSALAGGTKAVTATVGTASRIIVSRRTAPAAALGLLTVSAPAPGVGAAAFTVDAVAEATGVGPVVTDVSTFDWVIIN